MTIVSLLAVMASLIARSDADAAPLFWPALFGLITARFYKARRVEFDDRVVIAHGFWRRRSFAWTDVESVVVVCNEGRSFAPMLRLKNGKRYRIAAGVRRSFRNHAQSVAAVSEWVDAMNRARGIEAPPARIEPWLIGNMTNPSPAVPPKPETPSQRRWRLVFAMVVVALFLWAFAIFVRNEVDDITLAHYGVVIQAQVVGHDHVDGGGDGGSSDYLWIAIPACQCNVEVPTDNPAGHPDGSTIPARYDPSDPSNAQSLVDVPLQWPSDLVGGGSFVLFFVLPSVAVLALEWRRWRHPPPPARGAEEQPATAAQAVLPAEIGMGSNV